MTDELLTTYELQQIRLKNKYRGEAIISLETAKAQLAKFHRTSPEISPYALPSDAYDKHFIPPDSPELREKKRFKLAQILLKFERATDELAGTVAIDQILALIEEAIHQAKMDSFDKGFKSGLHHAEDRLEEAKREERKEVMAILEKEYPAITTWQCWQSLKEGK